MGTVLSQSDRQHCDGLLDALAFLIMCYSVSVNLIFPLLLYLGLSAGSDVTTS